MPRTDRDGSDLAAKMAALEARLERVEGRLSSVERGPTPDLEGLMEVVFGAEAVGHMKAARREDLLTVRALLDTWIERLGKGAPAAQGTGTETAPAVPAARRQSRRREKITLE